MSNLFTFLRISLILFTFSWRFRLTEMEGLGTFWEVEGWQGESKIYERKKKSKKSHSPTHRTMKKCLQPKILFLTI